MATVENKTSIRHSYVFPGPQDVFAGFAKWLRLRRKRAEIRAMLDLEEWVLDDMGVSRMDVIEALSRPGDPSVRLNATVCQKLKWRRQRQAI